MRGSRGTKALLAGALCLVLLPACGSDGGGGGGGSSATSPAGAAAASVDSAQEMGALKTDAGSETGLGAAMKLYADLQALVNFQAAANLAGTTGSLESEDEGWETSQGELSTDCLQAASGGNATYADCEVAGATFNGSIATNGDAVTIDLEIAVDPSAYTAGAAGVQNPVTGVKVTERGTLTITETKIEGTIDIGIKATLDLSSIPGIGGIPGAGGTQEIPSDIQAIFDVTLENACAVAGTIVITSSGGMTFTGNQNVTATFDGCGNATVQ